MTRNQAIALSLSEWWTNLPDEQIVRFQLFEDRLCMPFDRFHKAIEAVLKRPVWTHEFADPRRLQEEYLGDRLAPTMQEIIELIPADKRIVLLVD